MDRIRKMLNIDELNQMGYTGRNVGVAVLDTGVANHPDLCKNIVCFKDFVNGKLKLYDDNGHGTHVAGIIASSGISSNGIYKGIAPESKIIMIKCLNQSGNGKVKNVIRGFDFIVKNRERYNIKIVNISVGAAVDSKDKENHIILDAVEELWKKGFVVVVAAGNNGPQSGSVTVPGCAKSVITVGASDDNTEVTISGNKKMVNYSGRGPTNVCVIKPEIICPGTGIVSCSLNKSGYSEKSGTSMATPVVSGVISLLMQKNPSLTNKEVKWRLYLTSKDVGLSKSHQGWGQIDPMKLLTMK